MPTIKKNGNQETALKEISETLNLIKSINVITAAGWTGPATISFSVKAGRNGTVKIPFAADDKNVEKLVKLAESYRTKLAREIEAKASKFSIELESEDLAIMNAESTTDSFPQPSEPEPSSEEIPDSFGEPVLPQSNGGNEDMALKTLLSE